MGRHINYNDATLQKSYCGTLRILYFSFLEEGVYPDDWKKNNVVPIHKKESLIKKI